jgi:hypothetical protein
MFLVKLLFCGKTFIISWLKLYFLAKPIYLILNFYYLLVLLLSFNKIYISSWLNFYLFLAKFLSFGKTSISFWLKLYILAKAISIFG